MTSKLSSSLMRSGFSFTRPQLEALMKLKRMIKAESLSDSSTGRSFVSDFSRGAGARTESDEWGDI